MKKNLKQFLCFGLAITCSLFFFFVLFNPKARKLNKIPLKEREYLEHFFRTAFTYDGLGYTLFGDKPVTETAYFDPGLLKRYDPIVDSLGSLRPFNLRMKKGYECLEKYRDLFSSKNIKITRSKNFTDNELICVFFINVREFAKTVNENLKDFKDVLGNDLTPELLLERILHSEDIFGEVLKNHQGLIGTLLGFGRNNAWLFHQREEREYWNRKSALLSRGPFTLKLPHRRNFIEEKLRRFDDEGVFDFNPLFLSLPAFAADPNSIETQQLKKKYLTQYHAILQQYRNKDFLEVTLRQITTNQ